MCVSNPPKGMHRITAQLYYQDIEAAIIWLQDNFFCTLTEKFNQPNGECIYAELNFLDAIILVAPQTRYKNALSPKQHGKFSASVLIYIDNITLLSEQFALQGLLIIEPLTLQAWGDKTIRVLDCEGHLWTFAEHIKNVAIGV